MRKALRHTFVRTWLAFQKFQAILATVVFLCICLLGYLHLIPQDYLPAERFALASGDVPTHGSPSFLEPTEAAFFRGEVPEGSRDSAPARRIVPVPDTPDAPAGGPVPPLDAADDSTPIHLVMSAFRDGDRCARTMGFAFTRAKHPERIHIRVMQALDDGDTSCIKTFAEKQLKEVCKTSSVRAVCEEDVLRRVHVWTIPKVSGMGPAHQRGLLNEVRDFQDSSAFCLNTDSHMDSHQDWDIFMINEWVGIGNEFAVVTAYPMRMMPGQDRLFATSHVDLCGFFLENGIPRGQGGDNLHSNKDQQPYLTMNWAAGFAFARCHADRNVPVDKYLRYIFTGEEVDRAVRLWTHGYDLYLPAFTYIYHDYDNPKQEFWRERHDPSFERVSRERLARKLQLDLHDVDKSKPLDLGIYGLGTQRSLEQYVEWSRVNWKGHWTNFLRDHGLAPVDEKNQVNGPHWYCQTLKRVPVRDSQALQASVYEGGLPHESPHVVNWASGDAQSLPVHAFDTSFQ